MLIVEDLSFSYGKTNIFNQLSFSLDAGTCLAIAGPNGSGKSTLLSVLAGILPAAAGSIRAIRRIGYVPQGIALFEDMTVMDNLKFFAALAHAPIPEKLPFGIRELCAKPLSSLSLGTRKRVSILCALLGDPDILLLDEPCAGLDLCYREELVDLLTRLKQEGRTIVYVGHEPAEFASYFDHLLLLGGDSPAMFSASSIAADGGIARFLIRAEKEIQLNRGE